MTKFQGDPGVIESQIKGVTKYVVDNISVYKILVENFLSHFTNVYLILDREASLVDLAFDGEKPRADLEKGFATINKDFNESVGVEDARNIIITHGHEDHFGMLGYEKLKGKRVYIHQLDSGVIKNYQREYSEWIEQLGRLAKEAGCNINLENLFVAPTQPLVQPTDYEFIEVRDEQKIVNGYVVYHAPGHSPGQICLKVGSILFLGDHLLSFTTPHQSPKSSRGAGLQTYLSSLRKVADLGIELGLPGHEDTIYSVKGRAEEIEGFHYQRLEELVELCQEEKNLFQLTTQYYQRHPELLQTLYAELGEYNGVLALEEIKAHVEYLMENNKMVVTRVENGVIKYRSR